MMPRPNWATLPVMCRSVVTTTLVLVGDRLSAWAVISAEALPRPPVSRPTPLITARCVGVVAIEEVGLALELAGDRAELHLDDAAVGLAFDLLQFGARAGTVRSARRR